jgi:hypothetical protein
MRTNASQFSFLFSNGGKMSDYIGKVTGSQDIIKKLASYVPGFNGYVERQNRRAADKILRETVARRFDELYKRASALQTELIGQGKLEFVDDLEQAAIKIQTFRDKVMTATYGYSGFFDAVKINEKELEAVYNYDMAFFDLGEQIAHALDNVEASLGDDTGLPAAIRNLITLARDALEVFERRYEVINGTITQ